MTTTAPPTAQPVFIDQRQFEDFLADIYDLGTFSAGAVIAWCERECKNRGVPFDLIHEPRRNGKGQQIGPRMEISVAAGDVVLAVLEAMTKARASALEEVVGESASPVTDVPQIRADHRWEVDAAETCPEAPMTLWRDGSYVAHLSPGNAQLLADLLTRQAEESGR